MPSEVKLSLRELSPWLVGGLRLADAAVAAGLVYPIVMFYIGAWAEHYEILVTLAFFLTMVVFHLSGLYRPWRGYDAIAEMRTIFLGWVGMVGAVLFLMFAFKAAHKYSRVVLVTWFFLTPMVLFAVHGAARKVLHALRRRGKNKRRAVIVGAGDLGYALARHIEEIPWAGIKLLGFFDDWKTTVDLAVAPVKEKTILGKIPDLKSYLENHQLDFVYIALPMRAELKIHQILKDCRTLGARLFLVPDLYAFHVFNTRIMRLGSAVLLDFNPESSGKRAFDIAFALMVLIATLPATLVIALIIKLSDGGPVFYGHKRITVTGKEFKCLKFRSMRVGADKELAAILANDPEARKEWEETFKLKNDPRVTWIGRFLRKTSLDELPQFINVLRGEMSVVGARPIVQKELCDYYKDSSGIYCSIKPGITGPWQIGKRSDTEDYQERVELDTWYALNRTFWMDLKIVCLTVVRVLKGNGAY